ncbi:MAG TPA: SseB family protein [Dyella sp.]|uniref:SseB family protein n=1 Tax=Dyella sp. TaxID=1869338 RepID=UPI002D7A004B|nr:SseB family protein [Dyella sp.]HET6554213.1 SseB family protein [Dyella sp.]
MRQFTFSRHDALPLLMLFEHGAMAPTDAWPHALTAQVTLALRDGSQATGLAWTSRPVVLSGAKHGAFIAVFTTAERAVRARHEHPAYRATLSMPLAWVIQAAKASIGIAVNPGSPDSFELPHGLLEAVFANAVSRSASQRRRRASRRSNLNREASRV